MSTSPPGGAQGHQHRGGVVGNGVRPIEALADDDGADVTLPTVHVEVVTLTVAGQGGEQKLHGGEDHDRLGADDRWFQLHRTVPGVPASSRMRPISTSRTSARSPRTTAGDGAVDWLSAPRRSQSAERQDRAHRVQAALGGLYHLLRRNPAVQGGVGLLRPGGDEDGTPLGIGAGLDGSVAVGVGPAHLLVAVGNGPAGGDHGLMT